MMQRALPIQVRPDRHDRLRVQRALQALPHRPQSTHNTHDLAARLHISARTLHRQLKGEGTMLQAIRDAVWRGRK